MCWPHLCLCRPFCNFERCLDSNPESCRNKPASASNLATHLPPTIFFCADPISPLSDTWRVGEAILEDCFEDLWNRLSEEAQYSGNAIAQVPYSIAKNVIV